MVETPFRVIQLKFCRVEQSGPDIWTLFEDGTGCAASGHRTPHYHVIAHRCGYGDDVDAYCREHELMHSFCSEWFYDQPSPVLWALAHGTMLRGSEAAYEEIAAQAAQRWIRANERPIVGGVDWDSFKRKATELLDGF